MQRRSLLKATAGLATASLAGPAIGQDLRARTLRFVPQANLTSLDPVWTTAAVTSNHGYCVFDTLYGVDGQTAGPSRRWRRATRSPTMAGPGASGCARGCGSMTASRCGRRIAPPAWRAGPARHLRPDARRGGGSLGGGRRPHASAIRLKRPFPLLLDALGQAAFATSAFIMPERLARTDAVASR